MYSEFLITKNAKLAKTILEHNYEDVLNLVDLFPLIDRLDNIQQQFIQSFLF